MTDNNKLVVTPELLPRRSGQADNSLRHGHARHGQESPTWVSWQSMLARCRYPDRDHHKKHVGRGIKVCDRWLSFDSFLADMGERPAGTTLDRYPNNDGDYEPGNCRWATPVEQSRNRRNVKLTFDSAVEVASKMLAGESPKQVADQYGISESLPAKFSGAGRGRTLLPAQRRWPVSELKSCPFCGSSGDMLRMCDTRPNGTCWVSCDICEMEGPASSVGRDPAGAAEAWNTRTQPPAVEGLREALEPFADIAYTLDEVGQDDPADDRVLIVQAYGCQLAELSNEHFHRARAALAAPQAPNGGDSNG